MSTKAKIVLAYFVIALLSAVYMANWGANSYQSFAYNLGAGMVWPMMIPGVGKIIGAVVLVAVIALVLLS